MENEEEAFPTKSEEEQVSSQGSQNLMCSTNTVRPVWLEPLQKGWKVRVKRLAGIRLVEHSRGASAIYPQCSGKLKT